MQFELAINKNGLSEIRNRIDHIFQSRISPKEFLRQNSDMMDGIIRNSFQKAQSRGPSLPVCIMAVGGYGRSELTPYSDIDLLILYSSSDKEKLTSLIEKILYPLWDLGLDVNCSSRSIDECIKMAQSDLHLKTGLIDGRYLDGEFELFRKLYFLFVKKVLHKKVDKFAEALANDIYIRRHKYEDSVYTLEPNIKEGIGGLRDFQIGRWIIRAKYKTDRWNSILFPDHAQILDKGIQFLWAIRAHLHLLSGRRQDNLTFELQERIAPILGFANGVKGIEDMMREYHLSTQRISYFVMDIIERSLYEPSKFRKALNFFRKRKIDHHFVLTKDEIYLYDPITFKREPSQLMVLFKYLQDYRARIDFRTKEAASECLSFVDDRFRTSEIVNKTFLSILKKGEGIGKILKKMHEIGFLSRYIPEFSKIEGKVHYDLYHVHPIDIHSILAVEELEKLKSEQYQKEYPLLSGLLKSIEKIDILFLATLLHDIGKGEEGDHSLNGAGIASRICDRMGLSSEEKECVKFLIINHLLMIKTALRRDLNDEQTFLHFIDEVGDKDRLKMLYLLTFADIKAVGPEAWNSWKGSLLMELFLKSMHLFEIKDQTRSILSEEAAYKKLQQYLPSNIISLYLENLPSRYLSSYSWEEIARHIEMAHLLTSEPLIIKWSIEEDTRAKITVCTKDRYGLFSRIAGSMFINRINVLEAKIYTWRNGVALDTFYVEDSTKELERRLLQFEKDLKEILLGKVQLKNLISQRIELRMNQRKVIPKVPVEVKINNNDSDFYTIIETAGEDRLGILYDITKTLTDCGCNIHFAKISTLGNRIIDVFYIQDEWGEKIMGEEKLNHLKKTLLQCLNNSPG